MPVPNVKLEIGLVMDHFHEQLQSKCEGVNACKPSIAKRQWVGPRDVYVSGPKFYFILVDLVDTDLE